MEWAKATVLSWVSWLWFLKHCTFTPTKTLWKSFQTYNACDMSSQTCTSGPLRSPDSSHNFHMAGCCECYLLSMNQHATGAMQPAQIHPTATEMRSGSTSISAAVNVHIIPWKPRRQFVELGIARCEAQVSPCPRVLHYGQVPGGAAEPLEHFEMTLHSFWWWKGASSSQFGEYTRRNRQH